jgi:hypothetical protein
MKIVTYSLYVCGPPRNTDYHDELIYSVQSLRRYNKSVPVHVFLYGEHTATFISNLEDYAVTVHQMGAYEDAIRSIHRGPFHALTAYPVLHKWLNFSTLEGLAPAQILQSDCDTVFFDDVERLFQAYAKRKFYAREEPFSRASHYGYDPTYLDQDALVTIAQRERANAITPCNIGVCVLNRGLWREIAKRGDLFLSYVFRFVAGIAHNPQQRGLLWPELADALAHDIAEAPDAPYLPFPSRNVWILDQVALWLTLGHIPKLTHGLLSPEHVVQGADEPGFGQAKVMHHYFGTDKVAFRSEISRLLGWDGSFAESSIPRERMP